MSKRLQVLLSDQDYRAIQRQAKKTKLSVGAWVRQVLQKAQEETSARSASEKLRRIEACSAYSFPVGDIEQILSEIESGYLESKP